MEQADNKIMSFSKYTKYLNYEFHADVIMKMKRYLYDYAMVSQLQGDSELDNEFAGRGSEADYNPDETKHTK